MANVIFNNVFKEYPNGFVAVSNLDLEVKDKEFIVLVGPSGCGKSTCLRIVAGLEEISKGEVLIDGVVVNQVPPKDRDIAMVFQNYALYPHMTVYENMSFGLKLRRHSKSEIDKKVRDAALILGIENLLERKPKVLSGGQRQRVALGRAIVRNPKVFLMDEPLSNLDAKLRVQTRTEIKKLHNKLDATFIYVTHDQTEAMTMGDRIVIMKDGIIQQVDPPKQVYERPKNIFVAGFIGSPQMNFINVFVKKEGSNCVLHFDNGRIKLSDEESKPLISKGYIEKEIIAGVRPENIFCCDDYSDEYKRVALCTVDISEMLGAESYLYLKHGSIKLIARVDAKTMYKADQNIWIGVESKKVHFFDKVTEDAIL